MLDNYVYLNSTFCFHGLYWSEEETEEFQTKFRKIISQDDQTSTAQL